MTTSFIHSLERYVELEWDMGWSDDVNWKIKGKLHFTSLHVDSAMFLGWSVVCNCKLNENFNSLYRAPEHTSFNNVVNNLMQDLPPNLGTVT